MSIAAIPGQTRAKGLLQRMAARSRVPHGLLFTGEAGIGKSQVARWFAKRLNCASPQDQDSCDRCGSCRKMDSGQHADFLWVKKEGAFIKIDQVRQIKERLKFRPFEGQFRVVVVENAHELTEEAANAFLKILEEPPKRNVFILLSLEPRMVLPTIVSRCCHIRFQPLEESIIEQVLTKEEGVEPPIARRAAQLAAGSLDRARKLADAEAIAHREEIMSRIGALGQASMIDLFALTAKWAKETQSLDEDLECIKLWLREMIHNRLSTARPIRSRTSSLSSTAAPPDAFIDKLFRLYDTVELAHQQLRVNANKQLILEGVCLAIRKVLNG